jgi:hypothetical protein
LPEQHSAAAPETGLPLSIPMLKEAHAVLSLGKGAFRIVQIAVTLKFVPV